MKKVETVKKALYDEIYKLWEKREIDLFEYGKLIDCVCDILNLITELNKNLKVA